MLRTPFRPVLVLLLLSSVAASARAADDFKVRASLPVKRTVTDYADAAGHVEATQMVDIRARVNGFLIRMPFKEGSLVKAGDLLFEIDPRPYQAISDQAEAQVKLAQAQLKLAKTAYERDRAIAKAAAGSISQGQLDTDAGAVDEAAARVQLDEAALAIAKLNLSFTKVTSPIDGRVSRYYLTLGNLVNQDQTLLTTVVSRDPVHVVFDLDERTLLRCLRVQREKKIQDAKTPLLMALVDEPDLPHRGVVDFQDNRVDPKTGSIQMRGVFANPDLLMMPGMFARVRLPLGEPYPALLVSEAALRTEDGKKYLLVVDDKDVVHRRDVKVGETFDGLCAIVEGLKPTEWVVVDGAEGVRTGAKVNPQRVEMPAKKPAADE